LFNVRISTFAALEDYVRSSRPAYTLMEVILVMVILVVISALAVPVVTGMFTGRTLDAAADTVKGELTKTRSKAIENRAPYRFAIKENTGMYRIAPDTDDYWSGGSVSSSGNADGDCQEPQVIEGSLPEKVCFGQSTGVGMNSGAGSDWKTVATFLADGTALEDVQVSISSQDGAAPILIQLKASTGSVSVASLPASSNAN